MNENITFVPPIFHKIRILEKMPLKFNKSINFILSLSSNDYLINTY
jgi:hypothetical protein